VSLTNVERSTRPLAEAVVSRPRREPEKWVFLLPALLVVLVMSIFPFLFSLVLTFSTWILARADSTIEFSGLYNFQRMAEDARFWGAVYNTLLFVVISVPVQYLLGLGLAILLNQDIRASKFFRVLFFIPFMLSPVAIGWVIGKMLLNETQGPINHLLTTLGLPAVPWLSTYQTGLISLLMVDAWHSVPFMMILLLAGLQALPQEPFEAAKIDGASHWQCFRYLTFPMLFPVTLTVLLLRSIATFKIADVILVITGGGPGDSTESLTVYAYRVGVKNVDLGYATAMSQVLLWMVIAFVLIVLFLARRWATTHD
jgi:multiple sugar transport system permease protein